MSESKRVVLSGFLLTPIQITAMGKLWVVSLKLAKQLHKELGEIIKELEKK